MARHRTRKGREIDGVLVLDKPRGMSSNDAVQRAKRLFRARKVGHTGSLDPLATGVLPLCFGEATKFSQFLLESDKKYWARIKLGVRTNSGDADGEVIDTSPVVGVTRERIEAVLANFRGEIEQVPSMFSAVKHHGQPLYKLARQGIEVERASRRVIIHANELTRLEGDELELEIHCSKGTYVRTLAEEIGDALGCGGHVVALRRRKAGPYGEAELVTFDAVEEALQKGGFPAIDAMLLPIATAVRDWPTVKLSESTAYYVRQGQPVIVPHAPSRGWVRLMEGCDGEFMGVGEILDDGRVAPRRLMSAHG